MLENHFVAVHANGGVKVEEVTFADILAMLSRGMIEAGDVRVFLSVTNNYYRTVRKVADA